ncbi:MAG: glycosyltransferase [Candidatus Krumholzibacteriota bacterium]|nr:glycosyltransferase [Candidatus Krumholzibacteriota bacterium]
MRIVFLGDGSLNHIRRWAGYFHERGHEVLLLSFEDISGCLFPSLRLPKYLPTKLAGYLSAFPTVRRILKNFKPDLVNALYAGGYGFLASISSDAPLVVSTLGSDLLIDYPSSPVHRYQIRRALRGAALVTTDAENLSAAAIEAGVSSEKILKIFFGIEEDIFFPPAPSGTAMTREAGRVNIITTRNLYSVYNIDLLVDSAPMILKKTDALFTICGEGPLRNNLEEKVSRMGLNERFIFRGRLSPEEIAGELRNANIYVSTSLSDSTSVSLLEAMACGAIPVVTDIVANREWIENGKNGFLVPVDSPEALAEAVVESTRDSDRIDIFRKKNISIIKKKGLWAPNMRVLEERFLSMLGQV